jgi:hypothetical protein
MASNVGSVVPANYAELYTVGLMKKLRINESEDAAATILVKFIEKKALEKFNQDAEFETAQGTKKTTFQGYLSGFVSKYALQERDKQWTRARKIVRSTDQPVGEGGTPWLEVYGPTAAGIEDFTDVMARVDLNAAIERAESHLASLPVRGKQNLAFVFRQVIEQARSGNDVDRRKIADHMGVSQTAVCNYFKALRAELANIGFSPEALAV